MTENEFAKLVVSAFEESGEIADDYGFTGWLDEGEGRPYRIGDDGYQDGHLTVDEAVAAAREWGRTMAQEAVLRAQAELADREEARIAQALDDEYRRKESEKGV